MNLLGAMCWLSRDTTEGAETRSNPVRRARSGQELTGRKADLNEAAQRLCSNALPCRNPNRPKVGELTGGPPAVPNHGIC